MNRLIVSVVSCAVVWSVGNVAHAQLSNDQLLAEIQQAFAAVEAKTDQAIERIDGLQSRVSSLERQVFPLLMNERRGLRTSEAEPVVADKMQAEPKPEPPRVSRLSSDQPMLSGGSAAPTASVPRQVAQQPRRVVIQQAAPSFRYVQPRAPVLMQPRRSSYVAAPARGGFGGFGGFSGGFAGGGG